MKNRVLWTTAALISFMSWGAPAVADDIKSAYALCAWFDATKLLSEKCSIAAFSSAVDISVDMTPNDARSLCDKLPEILKAVPVIVFEKQWLVRIFSPYSGNRSIAVCDLPTK